MENNLLFLQMLQIYMLTGILVDYIAVFISKKSTQMLNKIILLVGVFVV